MQRTNNGPRNGKRINGKKKRVTDLDLRAAALDSPLLRESWSDGSPLNWLEFITGCKMGDSQGR